METDSSHPIEDRKSTSYKVFVSIVGYSTRL